MDGELFLPLGEFYAGVLCFSYVLCFILHTVSLQIATLVLSTLSAMAAGDPTPVQITQIFMFFCCCRQIAPVQF